MILVEEITQLEIDCSTNQAVEILLDEDEAAPILADRAQTAAAREAEERKAEALDRLRFAAHGDRNLRDLLTVLGLDG